MPRYAETETLMRRVEDLERRLRTLETLPVSNARRVTAVVGDGAATTYTVTHNFGTKDVSVTAYATVTGADVPVTVVRSSANQVSLTFTAAPAANSVRVLVVG